MQSLSKHLLIGLAVILVSSGAVAQVATGAMVGILEGKATLIRQASRFALAEGVALQNEDIIDTAPSSFVQIEFPDGGRIGVGGQSRLLLAPRAAARGAAGGRLYLLQGWLKITQPADKPLAAESITPKFEIGPVAGAGIVVSTPNEFALFVESGSVKLNERNAGRPPMALTVGNFVNVRAGEKPVLTPRPSTEFLQQMPRAFRDPLPGRAAKFRDNPVAPKPLGDVSYDEVAGWMSAEPALRLPLVERWRPRLRDKAFRAATIANLATHPEWDPLVFPEKAAKKKAEEKRQRELKAAAAAAAAASAPPALAPRAPD